MQVGQLRSAALIAVLTPCLALTAPLAATAQTVEPPTVGVQDYIPPENLDPNLMAIQIKRLEDRVLALEQTNERLVERVRVLTENYNALVQYLKGEGGEQSQ